MDRMQSALLQSERTMKLFTAKSYAGSAIEHVMHYLVHGYDIGYLQSAAKSLEKAIKQHKEATNENPEIYGI